MIDRNQLMQAVKEALVEIHYEDFGDKVELKACVEKAVNMPRDDHSPGVLVVIYCGYNVAIDGMADKCVEWCAELDQLVNRRGFNVLSEYIDSGTIAFYEDN